MYELPKNRTDLKCRVCDLFRMTQKTWSRIGSFTRICHCKGL